MAGDSNFPTALDDNTSLFDVTDGITEIEAAHHNNIKEAIKRIEAKIGIDFTIAPTSLDYRLGNATNSHGHGGASGQGQRINPTTIAFADGDLLSDSRRFVGTLTKDGSAGVGSNISAGLVFGRTAIIESVSGVLRRGPSGATSAFIVRVGPTHLYGASVGLGPRFAPGATRYGQPSPNLGTYPSGAIITLDAEAVGSNDPGQDLSLTFVFRG